MKCFSLRLKTVDFVAKVCDASKPISKRGNYKVASFALTFFAVSALTAMSFVLSALFVKYLVGRVKFLEFFDKLPHILKIFLTATPLIGLSIGSLYGFDRGLFLLCGCSKREKVKGRKKVRVEKNDDQNLIKDIKNINTIEGCIAEAKRNIKKQNFEEANDLLEKALEKCKCNQEILKDTQNIFSIINLYIKLKNEEKVTKVLEILEKKVLKDIFEIKRDIILANLNIKLKNFEKAKKLLEEAEKKNEIISDKDKEEDKFEIYCDIAKTHAKLGNSDKAKEIIEKVEKEALNSESMYWLIFYRGYKGREGNENKIFKYTVEFYITFAKILEECKKQKDFTEKQDLEVEIDWYLEKAIEGLKEEKKVSKLKKEKICYSSQ